MRCEADNRYDMDNPETALERPKSEEHLWQRLAIILIALTLVSAVRWMLAHPYAADPDEAWYINEAQIDTQVLHANGSLQLARWIIHGDPERPPAYRLIALPFFALFGYHTLVSRLVTFACFITSAWFIYLTTKRLAGAAAGAVAILVFFISPVVLQSSILFSTEGPLYLAVAGTLYFLSAYWKDNSAPRGNWIGLGLALGLGALSKTTFPAIALPVLALSIFKVYRSRDRISGLVSFAKAGAIAFLVAFFWWFKNYHTALGYALYSQKQWIRHYWGAHSAKTFALWFASVFMSLLGPGISILIGLGVILYFRKARTRRQVVLNSVHRTTLTACACAILPLVAAQLIGTNYYLRLVSPIMIPLAIAAGLLAGVTGWVHSAKAMVVSGILVGAQFFMLAFPVWFPNKHPVYANSFNPAPWQVMIRFEQWDWRSLRDISISCGINKPRVSNVEQRGEYNGQRRYGWSNSIGTKISYLGNGRPFNGSQIQYAWIAQGDPPPNVTWLWRYEDGPIDWEKVLILAGQSDVVITAPNYVGEVGDRQDVDNQHNAEFAQRLGQDSRFRKPIRLEAGQFDPVEVLVFVKKNLVCE